MSESRIKMAHPYGQTPPNVFSDFEWIHHHEQELLEKYGECSIIVYKQQVIGVGATYDEALQNAEQTLSPSSEAVTPVHERLRKRLPFPRGIFRVKG